MILTVTPNIALDRLVVAPGFQLKQQSRARSGFVQAGGSGVHAASIIQAFGGESKAIGFLGGHTGALWQAAALKAGLNYEVVPVAGETRESYCVIDPQEGSLVESVEAGPPCSPADLARLMACLEANLPGCAMLVISGSLPPGIPAQAYAAMIELAAGLGVKTLADIHSQSLQLAMPLSPWLIKPNLYEFHQLLGRQTRGLDDLAAACRKLHAESGTLIAMSMEQQGLLLTASEGQYWLRPPALEMHLPDGLGVNVIGCGDALVGALAFEYCRTGELLSAARLGLAAAHANLGTYGSPQVDPMLARQLALQIEVQPLQGGSHPPLALDHTLP
jgi:1-phosphofructokinase family hexose kinase